MNRRRVPRRAGPWSVMDPGRDQSTDLDPSVKVTLPSLGKPAREQSPTSGITNQDPPAPQLIVRPRTSVTPEGVDEDAATPHPPGRRLDGNEERHEPATSGRIDWCCRTDRRRV